ncbi:MAG TPA: hypothetical protein VK498_09055 [Ferruginibacter sp.]|nr:hypothetical protein [Ferruginibacter sp.]
MKTSKILLLIFCVFSSQLVLGQKSNASKAETENWIIEKFNTYVTNLSESNKETGIYREYSNYQFQLENGLLIIEYDQLFYMRSPEFKRFGEKKSKIKAVINISEIKEVSCGTTFDIKTFDQSIKVYWDNVQQKHKDNRAIIGFNCFAEENMEARLKKAFTRLKAFYPRKKKQEAF